MARCETLPDTDWRDAAHATNGCRTGVRHNKRLWSPASTSGVSCYRLVRQLTTTTVGFVLQENG